MLPKTPTYHLFILTIIFKSNNTLKNHPANPAQTFLGNKYIQ